MACTSRCFRDMFWSFTGKCVEKAVEEPDFAYAIDPLTGNHPKAGHGMRTVVGCIFALQSSKRLAQKAFHGWRGIVLMYPGYSVGTHEECSTDYHFVNHPLQFLGLGQSRSPQFLYANETRRERMAAWRINKEIATSNIPALLTFQTNTTQAERQDLWLQIACQLAYDTRESLGTPSDQPEGGGFNRGKGA